MKHPLRYSLLIVLATALSTLLFVSAFLVIGQYVLLREDPADYLPADKVIALLHKPTAEEQSLYEAWFPELGYVQEEGAVSIAILSLPAGRGTVSFYNKEKTGEIQRGNYQLILSDPELAGMLQEPMTDPLSKDDGYRAIRKKQDRDANWAYMTQDALPERNSFRERIGQALLFPESQFVIHQRENGVQIDSYLDSSTASIPMDGISVLPQTMLSLAVQNPRGKLQALLMALPVEEQVILEGVFRSLIDTRFGPSVSLEYDILPLMTQSTQLQLRTESGAVSFVLQGRGTSPEQVEDSLQSVHSSIRSTLPTTRVTTRTFDERFPSTIIESDPDLIIEEQSVIGPWQIHATRHRDTPHKFLTGQNGYRYVISNSATALEEVLTGRGNQLTMESAENDGVVTGAGVADNAKLNVLWQSLFPPEATPLLPYGPLADQITWKQMRNGRIETLILTQETSAIPLDSTDETGYPATTTAP